MGHASPTSCFIEEMEEPMADLPTYPEIRAKMMVDLSKPLIPGCFLPLHDSQVIWVYFRYESVFRFCKNCGCVGHYLDLVTYLILRLIGILESG